MIYYAIYVTATGALVDTTQTLPNPMPAGQASKQYDGPTPHPSYWDSTSKDFIVPAGVATLVAYAFNAIYTTATGVLDHCDTWLPSPMPAGKAAKGYPAPIDPYWWVPGSADFSVPAGV